MSSGTRASDFRTRASAFQGRAALLIFSLLLELFESLLIYHDCSLQVASHHDDDDSPQRLGFRR